MTEVIRLQTRDEIDTQAATWVWRLDSEDCTPQQRCAFEQWLQRDPRHRTAFENLQQAWRTLDDLSEAKREEKLATFTEPTVPLARGDAFAVPGFPWGKRVAQAAIIALAAVGISVAVWYQRPQEAQTLATAVGHQRTVELADGSIVYLNTNTVIETRFSRRGRDVQFVKGEAHFVVSRDPERPFRVYAGDATVQAVGTAFNVRLRGRSDVEVIVSEGRVEVTARPDLAPDVPFSQPIMVALDAGQRLATRDIAVARIEAEEIDRALAWRQGAIVFDGDPLAQAIEELNRYTELRFVVSDPEIGRLRMGGRFRTGDVDGFLHAMESALPVRVRRADGGLVYIEPPSDTE